MRLKIPLRGTVVNEDPPEGAPNDPIELVPIDLGNVSWELVSLDFENDLAEIEVTPSETVGYIENGEIKARPTTEQEKEGYLDSIIRLVTEHTKDELYTMSNCPRLKRPLKEKK